MPISVTPEGNVNLVKVPLENDYKNTFTFASATDQINYFHSLSGRKLLGSDYTYIKKDNKIRVATPIDEIINYNYLYYVNRGFPTEKRYFCFITRMEYVNENCTDIFIETDVFQTWYFQLEWNRCFVEREHTNNDNVGVNTYPEQLETGEYVTNSKHRGVSSTGFEVVVGTTIDLTDDEATLLNPSYEGIYGLAYGGVYSGLRYYNFTDTNTLKVVLQKVAKAGKSDGIVSMFMGNSNFYETVPLEDQKFSRVKQSYNAVETTHGFAWQDGQTTVTPPGRPTQLNGYVPRNKKLLTYPFCYILATNNSGSSNIYKYEDFSGAIDFNYVGTICPGMSIRMFPMNYKGEAKNYSEGITLGKLPTCSWNTDVYTNWITQNAVNIPLNIAKGTTEVAVGSALMGTGHEISGGSAVAGGVQDIVGTMGEIYQHSLAPFQIEGTLNSGDVNYANNNARIDLLTRSIKAEYAAKIDDYFDMFGYKTCRVKVPNITGRSQWNYIKTIDCNVDGDIPQEDLNTVKEACNKGITFWHNPSNIYNYSLSNNII